MIHRSCPQRVYKEEMNTYYIYSINYNLLKKVVCVITEEEKTKLEEVRAQEENINSDLGERLLGRH